MTKEQVLAQQRADFAVAKFKRVRGQVPEPSILN